MLVFLFVALVLHIIATIYHLYWSIYEFDSVVHFFAGIGVSLFFIWFYFFSGYFNPENRSLGKFLLIAILGVMMVSVLWETYEIIFKQTMVQKTDYPYDTMMDLIMDFLGAIVGGFYAHLKEPKKESFIPSI